MDATRMGVAHGKSKIHHTKVWGFIGDQWNALVGQDTRFCWQFPGIGMAIKRQAIRRLYQAKIRV